MAYSHCRGTGPGQVQGTRPGLMDFNILYIKVHTVPRQEGSRIHYILLCWSNSLYLSHSRSVRISRNRHVDLLVERVFDDL